jgi:hypothetical protein
MKVMKHERGALSKKNMRNPLYALVLRTMCGPPSDKWNIRVYDTTLKCYGTILGPPNDHDTEHVILKIHNVKNTCEMDDQTVVPIERLEYANCYEGDHQEPTLIQMAIEREKTSKPLPRKPKFPGMTMLLQEGRSRLKSVR